VNPVSFELNLNATSMKAFLPGSGTAAQQKQTLQLKFKSLRESLVAPDFLPLDFAKMDLPSQLHIGIQALYRFQSENAGALPAPWNAKGNGES
jgi:hypothetical protein